MHPQKKPSIQYCNPCDISKLSVAYKSSDLVIDSRTKKVFREGIEINLTQKEFKLLSLLYSDRGKVFSEAEILLSVWGIDFQTDSNSVQVYMAFIRAKVDKPFAKKLIHTKAGFGYSLI